MNSFPCPRCGEQARLKHFETFGASVRKSWFACPSDACRNHFKVVSVEGFTPEIVAQSPRVPRVTSGDMVAVKAAAVCPTCGAYGPVTKTSPHADGIVRRHECKHHGIYWSIIDDRHDVTVSKLRPAAKRLAA
jgi:endogenous inhibitor of DNA gyrase (YacG/DUF329 family)